MTGYTNSALLAIQVCKSELQTGAKCTEHLQTHMHTTHEDTQAFHTAFTFYNTNDNLTFPQARQWCLLLVNVNFIPHFIQT